MNITGARNVFAVELRKRAEPLDPQQRAALGGMLDELRIFALEASNESLRRNKYVMFAYWRVVAVYAGHFRRACRP